MATISGGAKFEQAMADLARKVNRPGTVKVGYLENSTYPDGKKVALIGAIQEFGAPSRNIPPRPAIRNMIADKSKGWAPATADLLRQTNYNVTLTLQTVGEGIKGQWIQSMRDISSPPLAEATVRRKGFTKLLVDTGVLINSVGVEVKT